MTFSLVLGAGGVVGMAYHAGALHALEEHGGLTLADADVVVGTSAGSVMGAFLRSGWTAKDMWDFAMGVHPLLLERPPEEAEQWREAVMAPGWGSPVDLARRAVGSAWVLARTAVRVPLPDTPALLRRAFPGGMFDNGAARERLTDLLAEPWPDRPLWLCTVDIASGRRVVLGRRRAPDLSLRRAVLASCAIPGVYPPVRSGRRTLVDGGAHSTTNLDLVGTDGGLVVGIAPMAYDPAAPPTGLVQIARRRATVSLSREVRAVRRRGAEVLLVRPSPADCDLHGVRLMRSDSAEVVARAAYESTCRLLSTTRFRRTLADLLAA